MKKFFYLLLGMTLSFSLLNGQNTNPAITAEEIQDHINYLASDELEGRFTGSKGERLAGDYIAKEFEYYGLIPMFDGSYFQEFPFVESVELTDNNSVLLSIDGNQNELSVNNDFITLSFSGKSDLKAELVFVGYGITAPMFGYDDYEGINVNGKVVLAMRHYPDFDSTESKFEKLASLRAKASTAKGNGAVGIIFMNEHSFFPRSDEFIPLKYDGAGGMMDFGAAQISREFADKIFETEGTSYQQVQQKINSELVPNSFAIKNTKIELKTEIKEIEKMGRNVAGYLEGNDPILKNEYIVVGGHYDHLGYGQTGSRYTGTPMPIHNGADDNASGTTGVLETAEKFASIKNQLKRSIVFVAFSGEELGLLGSNYFANNFPFGIENTIAMFNMDMIGRVNENSLTIIGSGTSTLWREIIEKENKYNFKLQLNDDGWGGSDHTAFTLKDIPVLFFFSGIHMDYHMPSDDPEKINAEQEENVVKFVFDLVSDVDARDEKPDFVKVKPQENQMGRSRSKIKIGTVPEFGYNGDGYKLSGVTEGSPAEKAGLLGGDIIIMFNGKDVSNIYDFMNAMGGLKEGETVDCKVLRGEEEKEFNLEL
ncbi:MAG: M28 family peptidase [Bacteroidetes bacterium]|nr:M28 family peptidase [Bacteroidota bacterium]